MTPETYALIGSLGLGFIFFYTAFQTYDKFVRNSDYKAVFQIMALTLFVTGMFHMIVAGKAVLDQSEICQPVVANETVSGDVTTYEYREVCTGATTSTNEQTYTVNLMMVTIQLLLVFLLVFKASMSYWKRAKLRGGNR